MTTGLQDQHCLFSKPYNHLSMAGKRTRQVKKEASAKRIMKKDLRMDKKDEDGFKTLPITLLSGFLVSEMNAYTT